MVRAWAAQGIDLNGIQKRLATECGVHCTFMDVRFLLLDNGIEIAVGPEPAKEPEPAVPTPEPEAESAPAAVKVTLDDIQIPGALISGKVDFPSGTNCAWMIDQTGRFAFTRQSAPPTPEELRAFEAELTKLLQRMG